MTCADAPALAAKAFVWATETRRSFVPVASSQGTRSRGGLRRVQSVRTEQAVEIPFRRQADDTVDRRPDRRRGGDHGGGTHRGADEDHVPSSLPTSLRDGAGDIVLEPPGGGGGLRLLRLTEAAKVEEERAKPGSRQRSRVVEPRAEVARILMRKHDRRRPGTDHRAVQAEPVTRAEPERSARRSGHCSAALPERLRVRRVA